MKYPMLYFVIFSIACKYVYSEIRNSPFMNKLQKIKAVGSISKFLPLTEIPPPSQPGESGRRHLQDCRYIPENRQVVEGANVIMTGDYYDDKIEKKLVTIQIPEHIDRQVYKFHLCEAADNGKFTILHVLSSPDKHFQVTTSVPYLTVGAIEAIGYHPSTKKSEHPSECEKIYQEFIAEQYSDESTDQSEESLEMARMPLAGPVLAEEENRAERFYDDILEG